MSLAARLALLALVGLASAAAAQDGGVTVIPLEPVPGDPLKDPDSAPVFDFAPEVDEQRDRVTSAAGGVVRGLDKITGAVGDVSLARGETKAFGRIQITLGDCRYPTNNPSGDAYAYLVIRAAGEETPEFAGWMVASSPALNPLEHHRYDVWVLRCSN